MRFPEAERFHELLEKEAKLDALTTRHARAIEALRGCVDWMEGHFCPEDGQCEFCRVGRERVAAARADLYEEVK